MTERTFTVSVTVSAPADYSTDRIAQFIQNELDDLDGDLSNAEVRY